MSKKPVTYEDLEELLKNDNKVKLGGESLLLPYKRGGVKLLTCLFEQMLRL